MTLYGKHNLLLESGDALLLENGFNLLLESDFGASVENSNASTDRINNYEICDRTGFRVLPGTLVRDGQTGGMVRPQSMDQQHPQSRIRSVSEKQTGSIRPEADDNFLTSNQITLSDF